MEMENNEEFTKEQAIKLHRDMWKWITKQIARNKEPLYIDELKEKYIANHTEFESVNYDCFACEYAKQEQQKVFKKWHGFNRCKFCPLEWGTAGDEDGYYMCLYNNKIGFNESLGLYNVCKSIYFKYLMELSNCDKKVLGLWKKQAKLAYKIAMLPAKEE